MIYLDNSATTKVDEEVAKLMNVYFTKHYGNPSSLHKMGIIAEKAVRKARIQLASLINVEEDSIYFTSGGTEGNNLAIISAINKNKWIGKKIITSKIEHPSVLEVFKQYEKLNYEVCYLDVDNCGLIDLEQLEYEINKETVLISLMKVNNEVGTVQDTKKISKIIKSKSSDCIFHSDCVQAIGNVEVNPSEEGVDIITFSGHKFHGPKGIGGIYIDKKLSLNPLIFGGGQEGGLRSGTENVPGIVGIGLAAEIIENNIEGNREHLFKLNEIARKLLAEQIEGVHFNSGTDHNFAPHILNISIEGVKSEIILRLLEQDGVFVSAGSACSSRKRSQSHVLIALGLSKNLIDAALRISFSKYNTVSDLEFAIDVLRDAVKKLRKYTRR